MTRSTLIFGIAITIAVSSPAGAVPVPPCDTLQNPIYLQVGDTQLNLMKRLGRALRDNTAKPITLVFVTSGSCVNIDNMYHRTAPITANMQYVPSIAEDSTWQPSSATLACSPPTGGVFPDIANSALFNSACTTETPPTNVKLTTGPTQAYVLAVPKASGATAITFEEAYFLFGFGPLVLQQMAGSITPWTDETQLFIRTSTKSTLLAWAANISVPVSKWHGMAFDGSPMVVSALQGSTNPGAAIGILGAEVYDANRLSLTALAFRANGQYAAYYPDSTSTSRDKQNVRDGHYTVWSPTIWMNKVTGGSPDKPDTQYVIDLIAGKPVTPAPSFESSVIVAQVGLVPDCAMRVKRSFEGGPLSLYKPSTSCVCKFMSSVDATSCQNCTTTCATGTCRDGYCEEF
ncbi:MAG: hypothetical protein JWO36_4155 [Myxococcales bacterium]|nr:hypothetical protein [Myxococcales bacterium]